MKKTSEEIALPASSLVQPNIPIPSGVRVSRQPENGINSANTAGGEVSPDHYKSK